MLLIYDDGMFGRGIALQTALAGASCKQHVNIVSYPIEIME
jgi:hypothetical protein